MADGIRIVAVTNDDKLYKLTLEKLNFSLKIASSSIVTDPRTIETSISRGMFNVIIWDYDFNKCNLLYLTTLVGKYNVLVILTALTGVISVPAINSNSIKFLPKPTTEYGYTTFADNAKKHITAVYVAQPRLSHAVANKIVGVNEKIIAIASSTGGTSAIEKILLSLPPDCPPILIVQHIIVGFSSFFATRLNSECKVEVREARSNDYLYKGLVLIAPADMHMTLAKRDDKLMVECFHGEKVNCVMPAADILFESISKIMRGNATGVILTGMGADGARGLLKMRNAGAKTIGQDEKTCVVYGMPKVAYDIGAVQKQLPLDSIAEEMLK